MRILAAADIMPVVRIVNFFPARPGASWGPRAIPDLELILVVDGVFEFVPDEGAPVPVKAGDVLCIEPGRQHTFAHVSGGTTISCIHLELVPDGRWEAADYRLEMSPSLCTAVADKELFEALFQRSAQLFSGVNRYRELLLQTVVREICLRLLEHWQTPGQPRLPVRTAEMVQYLRDRLTSPVSRRDLATAFNLTPQHVNAIFRQDLGVSPTQFVLRERIQKAYRLLVEDGMPVKTAAAAVGFQDLFYFSRVFKRIIGTTPGRVS